MYRGSSKGDKDVKMSHLSIQEEIDLLRTELELFDDVMDKYE